MQKRIEIYYSVSTVWLKKEEVKSYNKGLSAEYQLEQKDSKWI